MGLAKHMMMQQQEQGWSFSDDRVCIDCVDDGALATAIETASTADMECSFCGNSPSAPLDRLLDAFVAGVRREYDRAIDRLYIEDGEYQGASTLDTYDLVHEFGDILTGPGLLEAVVEAMEADTWVERDFAWRHRDEVLTEAWDQFCNAVKFETRYVIWLQEEDPDASRTGEVPVGKILHEVGRLVELLHLARVLPAGSQWWRAQDHSSGSIAHTAERLGTSPPHLARQPNRMSPAGIPMFYGAADEVTAIREVALGSDSGQVTWGVFESSSECCVLDFTQLPPVPSIFDPEWGSLRRELVFLHRFVRQLSDRVRPQWEAVDYVPTQILTEFFLRTHESPGLPIVGLVYASAITGSPAIVLDVPNDRCVERVAGWASPPDGRLRLGLVDGSVKSRAITPTDRGL